MTNTKTTKTTVPVELDSGILSTMSSTSPKQLRIRVEAEGVAIEVTLTGDQVLRMMSGSTMSLAGTIRTTNA